MRHVLTHSIESIHFGAQKATISANASLMGTVSAGGYTAYQGGSGLFTIPFTGIVITQGDVGLITAVLGLLLALIFGLKKHALEKARDRREEEAHAYLMTGKNPYADDDKVTRY